MKNNEKTREIKLDYLARVEGEGSFYVKIKDHEVIESKLKIFEPPRFFEGFLQGRSYSEVPDITARICGICPVAYQMSSVHAMEKICGYKAVGFIDKLRRLLYCGEWIESHALHTFMLHVPDFLGYPDAIAMAKDHKDWVEKALYLKKAGNDIVNILGGREIHPINVKVGGFYRYPYPAEFKEVKERLQKAQEIAHSAAQWMATLEFPGFEFDYEFIALHNEGEYPMNHGHIVSNKGLSLEAETYEDHFSEEQQPYSTTLHTWLDGERTVFTGPLARFNINFEQLSETAKSLAREIGLYPVCKNPFKSLLVRMIEIFYACEEAVRIMDQYVFPGEIDDHVKPKAGVGRAATEAPRGILFHRYEINERGIIQNARIVAPTSHNQRIIEDDLRRLVIQFEDLNDELLTERCEQAVRNYDPCISCSTHFLKVNIERE
ncbi:MAG: Ni/Fe hydrogenase subunit alpha [Cyclobacteriaceae bacterium]|nr:Ni/Fe hydrogenase subunit alpha [Cyclobacteriaceae bacterium]